MITCLGLVTTPSAARDDHAIEPLDLWYVLEINGQRSGVMHRTRTIEGDLVTTTSDVDLEVRRGPIAIGISTETVWVETRDGEPVEMRSVQDLGVGQPSVVTHRFLGDGSVEITRKTGGVEQRETAEAPDGDWVTPAESGRRFRAALARGAEEIAIATLDPSTGLDPVTTTRRAFERTTVESLGRTVPAIRCVSTVTSFPGAESTEFVDERGEVIRSTVNVGMLEITSLLADRELATSPIDPPELMASVFVSPDKTIPDARGARKAAYVLSVPDGEFGEIPSEGVQRVETIDDRSVRVVIDLDATPTGLGEGEVRADFLGPTPTLQAEDEEIVSFARGAAPGEADPRRLGESLRRAVHRHITGKALSVGFATAAETVRTREGDCTEHGVLLAAVLRARGIPSRVASGLIYADAFAGSENIFGYHMWTQALLPDADGVERWVDLDATLPASTPYDATHITLAVSDLAGDGPTNSLVALAPLMGRLAIAVESVE